MCGICGLVNYISNGVMCRDTVVRMTSTLHHRGPDRSDVWMSESAGLGHARLSIIDLTEAGNQPMRSEDGRYVIVYNGEVYNFSELRSELEREGTKFNGHSDTEVILYAYARHGFDIFSRLNGIFAFVIWDTYKQELVLVRDRFGVKPLYFHRTENGIIFGSEIKAVLASGLVAPHVSPQALHEFCYFGVPLGTNSMYEGIERLESGAFLRLSKDNFQIRPYWRIEDVAMVSDNEENAAQKIRLLLEKAVKRQLVSDVPVGIFLSGGIDSSAVTAFASRHYGSTIKTYSVGFDFDRGVNELPKAKMIADHFGTDHHELHIRGTAMPPVIEDLIRHHDEPFSDAANIPLYLLCRELNGETRVVLQGMEEMRYLRAIVVTFC